MPGDSQDPPKVDVLAETNVGSVESGPLDDTALAQTTANDAGGMSGQSLQEQALKARVRRGLFDEDGQAPRVGRYSVLRVLGEGGMGTVYAVYDDTLDRRVALKLVKGRQNEDARARMLREAQAMAKLSHPNVVPVFEVGEHEGQLYIAMEFVKGVTLKEWQDQEERPWRDVLDKYLEAARGLIAAHQQGLVHRDFKPHNVMVGRDGRARVLDFGLAGVGEESTQRDRPTGEESTVLPRRMPAALDTPLTQDGALMGTPAYMPPEQAMGSVVDQRSDQFSFCVSLWEALAGGRPFTGETAVELFNAVAKGDFATSVRSDVPTKLRSALERGLQSSPEDRWPDMPSLLGELEGYAARRTRSPARTWIAIGSFGAIAAVAVAVAQSEGRSCRKVAAELDDTWDDERREALREGLAAVEHDEAEELAGRVDTLLEQYAVEWRDQRKEICEARTAGGTDTKLLLQRLECLQDREDALLALVEVLEEPTPERLATAPDGASQLPPVASCADEDYVASDIPLPEDAEVRAEVEAIRAEGRRVPTVLFNPADADDAVARLEVLRSRAAKTGYEPVRLEILNKLALAHWSMNRPDAGLEAANEGYALAGAASREEAAENHAMRALLLSQKGDAERALLEAHRVVSIIASAYGEDSSELVSAYMVLAQTLMGTGDFEAAEEIAGRAKAIVVKIHDDDHPMLDVIGQIELAAGVVSGEHDQRILDAQAALAEAQAAEPSDPEVVSARAVDLATLYMIAGRPKDVMATAQLAVDSLEGRDSTTDVMLRARGALVSAKLQQGRYHEVIADADTALSEFSGELGVLTATAMLTTEIARISAYVELGQPARALEVHAEVVDRWGREGMMFRRMTDFMAPGVGSAKLFTGQYAESDAAYEAFGTALKASLGGENAMFTEVYLGRGMAKLGMRDYEGAREALEKSRDLLPDAMVSAPDAGRIVEGLGLLQFYEGDYAGALVTLRKAMEQRASGYGESHPSIATLKLRLAATQWMAGERGELVVRAQAALAARVRALGEDSAGIANACGLVAILAHASGRHAVRDEAIAQLARVRAAHPRHAQVDTVAALVEAATAETPDDARIAAAIESAHAAGHPFLSRFTRDVTRSVAAITPP